MLDKYQKPEVFISNAQLREKAKELGAIISEEAKGKELHVIGILKGSIIFMAELVQHIKLPITMDFIGLSSYGDQTQSTGVVKITMDLTVPIQDKDVLIVEDIIDTGLTMSYLIDNLKTRNPRSIKICTLLRKPENEKIHVDIDYWGFIIPNKFVVGYGLDFAEYYRNLDYLGVLKDE